MKSVYKMSREELIDEISRLNNVLAKKRSVIKKMRVLLIEKAKKTVHTFDGKNYPDAVFSAVEERFDISKEVFLSGSRLQQLIRCKMIAGYVLRKITNMSLYEIGAACNVDHACINHYVNNINSAYAIQGKNKWADDLIADVEFVKKTALENIDKL